MLTKDELKNFRVDFSNTIKDLEKKYNLKIELSNISFDESSFHTKMVCTKISENGNKIIDMKKFNMCKELYGLNANVGDKFTAKGIILTVTDFDTRKSKQPVLLIGSDGKSYKCSVDAVNRMIATK
jgi:hypothetical protein